IFSLSKLRKITDDGVRFRSHVDGKEVFFSPERVIEIQENLGVDIAMVLDECLHHDATRAETEKSLKLTLDWARRSQNARTSRDTTFSFGIVQGGFYSDLRVQAANSLIEMNFDGYAVGGLSVGESRAAMLEMTDVASNALPTDKVRYLMGVGTPSDIVNAVYFGIDMFDCVIPTRSARFGRIFTKEGFINIRNSAFKRDETVLDQGCDCYTCQTFSKA